MNSKQDQQPRRTGSASERKIQELTDQITETIAYTVQLKRTLWLVLNTTGNLNKPISLDQTQMNPLWDLKLQDDPSGPGKVIVKAGQLPEPTEEQLAKLCEILIHTSGDPKDFRQKVGIDGVNREYLIFLMGSPVPEGSERKPICFDRSINKWTYGTLNISPKPQPPPHHGQQSPDGGKSGPIE